MAPKGECGPAAGRRARARERGAAGGGRQREQAAGQREAQTGAQQGWGGGWGRARPPAHGHLAPAGRQRSSVPLQVLLFLNGWYSATYFLLEGFVFVYKGEPPPHRPPPGGQQPPRPAPRPAAGRRRP